MMNSNDQGKEMASAAIETALASIGIIGNVDLTKRIIYLSKTEPDQEARQFLTENDWEVVSTL